MKFTAENLKTCYVVECRNGQRFMIMRGFTDRLVGKSMDNDAPRGWLDVGLDENMCDIDDAHDWMLSRSIVRRAKHSPCR